MLVSQEPDDDRIRYVTLAYTPRSETELKQVAVDARASGLGKPRLDEGLTHIIYQLHVDLFAGLPGMLFLGAMGVLLLIAIASGVVLHGPFMRKLEFGRVRHRGSHSTRWLDMHNMLRIVTLAWACVVGLTGVINTLADPIIDIWNADEAREITARYKNLSAPRQVTSLQQSVAAALALEPGQTVRFIAFPGTTCSNPHHYRVFLRDSSPLSSRLVKPVLVDARIALVTDSRHLPWYVTGLPMSQPLHFGDYGGIPLKILQALLDLATIVVLGSSLYLWLRRGRTAHDERMPLPADHAIARTDGAHGGPCMSTSLPSMGFAGTECTDHDKRSDCRTGRRRLVGLAVCIAAVYSGRAVPVLHIQASIVACRLFVAPTISAELGGFTASRRRQYRSWN